MNATNWILTTTVDWFSWFLVGLQFFFEKAKTSFRGIEWNYENFSVEDRSDEDWGSSRENSSVTVNFKRPSARTSKIYQLIFWKGHLRSFRALLTEARTGNVNGQNQTLLRDRFSRDFKLFTSSDLLWMLHLSTVSWLTFISRFFIHFFHISS